MQKYVMKTLRKCYVYVKCTCYKQQPLTNHLQCFGTLRRVSICMVSAKNLSSHYYYYDLKRQYMRLAVVNSASAIYSVCKGDI